MDLVEAENKAKELVQNKVKVKSVTVFGATKQLKPIMGGGYFFVVNGELDDMDGYRRKWEVNYSLRSGELAGYSIESPSQKPIVKSQQT